MVLGFLDLGFESTDGFRLFNVDLQAMRVKLEEDTSSNTWKTFCCVVFIVTFIIADGSWWSRRVSVTRDIARL